MRGVARAGAEVQVKRLVGGNLLGVGDELDGLVRQVLGQVIALFGGARRLDLVIVIDQLRIPLAAVPAEEPVEPLEAAPQRPAVERPGRRLEFRRHQVVFADQVGAIAVPLKHLRQEPVLKRDAAVIARVTGRQLIDRRRGVGMMVAPGDDARPRRGAQRRGVHVVVQQAPSGQRVQVRRRDRAAVTAQLPVPNIIQHNDHYIRRSGVRPQRPGPRRAGLIRRPPNHARKRGARLVFVQRHNRAPMVGTVVACPVLDPMSWFRHRRGPRAADRRPLSPSVKPELIIRHG